MAVTAYKFPGTVVNDTSSGSGDAWTNPGNVSADDTSEAVWSVPTSHTNPSQYLKCTNFGFTASDIPSGSTIDGIEVEYRRREVSVSDDISTSHLRAVKGGSINGTNVSTMNTAEWIKDTSEAGSENIVEGGSSNLWNDTWTQADIVASDFGVALAVTGTGFTPEGRIDYIKVRVYYSAAASTTMPPPDILTQTAL